MSQSEATGPRSPATAHSLRLTQRLSQVESVPPRLPAQPTRCRVTLPPCETDGSSGRSNPQASKNQITVPNSGSWGPFATQPTTLAANSAAAPRIVGAPPPRIPGNHGNLNISANPPEPRKPPHQLGAADLGNNTAPTRFPSAAAIPAHSTIQCCPPSRHPTYPSAHPARAGVRSESPSLSAASLRRLSPPPLSATALRRLSPPPLSAAALHRRSPPPLSAASLLRLSPPPLSCIVTRTFISW